MSRYDDEPGIRESRDYGRCRYLEEIGEEKENCFRAANSRREGLDCSDRKFGSRVKEEEVYFNDYADQPLKPCYSDSSNRSKSRRKLRTLASGKYLPKIQGKSSSLISIVDLVKETHDRNLFLGSEGMGKIWPKKKRSKSSLSNTTGVYRHNMRTVVDEPRRASSLKPILKNRGKSKSEKLYSKCFSKAGNTCSLLEEARDLCAGGSVESKIDQLEKSTSSHCENAKYLTSRNLNITKKRVEREIDQIIGLQISEKRVIKMLASKLKEKAMVIETLNTEHQNLFKKFEEACEENKELERKLREFENKIKKKVTIYTPQKNHSECKKRDYEGKYALDDEYKFKSRQKSSLRTKLKSYLQSTNFSQISNLNSSMPFKDHELTQQLNQTHGAPRRASSLNVKERNSFTIYKENRRLKKFVAAMMKLAKKLTPLEFSKKLKGDDKSSIKYLWKWLKSFFEEYMKIKMELREKNGGSSPNKTENKLKVFVLDN